MTATKATSNGRVVRAEAAAAPVSSPPMSGHQGTDSGLWRVRAWRGLPGGSRVATEWQHRYGACVSWDEANGFALHAGGVLSHPLKAATPDAALAEADELLRRW